MREKLKIQLREKFREIKDNISLQGPLGKVRVK